MTNSSTSRLDRIEAILENIAQRQQTAETQREQDRTAWTQELSESRTDWAKQLSDSQAKSDREFERIMRICESNARAIQANADTIRETGSLHQEFTRMMIADRSLWNRQKEHLVNLIEELSRIVSHLVERRNGSN